MGRLGKFAKNKKASKYKQINPTYYSNSNIIEFYGFIQLNLNRRVNWYFERNIF